jgi:hypothetical protein
VDVPRFLYCPWFINFCSSYALLKISANCVYCVLFVFPTLKEVDSHKLSQASGHITCLNVKECVVYVYSVWILI